MFLFTQLLAAAFIAIGFVVLLVFCIQFWRFSQIINKIPGPPIDDFLIGNVGIYYLESDPKYWFRFAYNRFLGFTRMYQKEGIFKLWFGPFKPLIILFNANNIEPLLSSSINIEKAYEYKFLKPWLEFGILACWADKWRTTRKLLNPAFHHNILEKFFPTIIQQKNILFEKIDKNIAENGGIVHDIRPLIIKCALDIICETAMGVKSKAESNPDYFKAAEETFAVAIMRTIKPWLWFDFTFKRSDLGKYFQKQIQILHDFSYKIIQERKSQILQQTFNNEKRLRLLDILLKHHMKNQLTIPEVRAEVDGFTFAGHDTTASSLIFTLLLIGLEPEVQGKVHQEMDEIFSNDPDREINIEDLRRMNFLEQCIKESLRLYPPVQLIGRHVTQEFMAGKYRIPAGSTCYIPLMSLHRDPMFFPDPEKFHPERFSEGVLRHPYAYIPFSAGPRNCIAKNFAILEEKTLLAAIIRRYKVTSLITREDIHVDLHIVLKSTNKLPFKFHLRS